MTLRAIQDRLIVKRAALQTQSAGGIVLLDIGTNTSSQGEVLAVGPGKLTADGVRLEMSVNVGDTVLFGKTAGLPVKYNNVDLLSMTEDEVFGVLDKENN
jgi:chaperonin GroES